MSYGLTSTGWSAKSAATIEEELAAAQRASSALGPTWVTSPESVGGQLNAVFAPKIAELWELGGVVFRSRDPRAAGYAGLDAVCSLTGTTRRAATKGTVTLTVTLGAGRTLPAGAVAHVSGQAGNRWVTLTSVTNSSGGTATRTVAAEAESAGVYVANAGTITGIATPVTGWLSVTNAADAAQGITAESDPVLRTRRERELSAGGTSPVDAVRAALSRVSGVSVAEVAENPTGSTAGGLPPHSIEAIVQGGTDADVALALWRAKAGGVELYSSAASPTVVTITDAGGFSRDVTFTRPAAVNCYAELTIVIDAGIYPGDASLQSAVALVTAGQRAGQTLRMSDAIIAARGVAGVRDVTRVRLGRTAGSLAETNLLATPRDVLKLASDRVSVVLDLVQR